MTLRDTCVTIWFDLILGSISVNINKVFLVAMNYQRNFRPKESLLLNICLPSYKSINPSQIYEYECGLGDLADTERTTS